MEIIINYFSNKIKALTKIQRTAFLSAVIAGLSAHGYGMANNYIYHDATILDGLGITFGIGRWALGFSGLLNNLILGNFNLPFLNVATSLFFIALSSMTVVKIFSVKKSFTAMFIGALMTVYPVVTSSFAYNFTATYYFLSLYLVCLSIEKVKAAVSENTVLTEDGKKPVIQNKKALIIAVVISALMIALSAGFYQAYLSVAATLSVAILLVDIYINEKTALQTVMNGVIYAVTLLSGLIFYLVLNKISMAVTNNAMVAYQGAEDFGKLEPSKLLGKLIEAYMHFFYIKWNGINAEKSMWAFVILFILMAVIVICKNLFKKKMAVSSVVLFFILTAILPVAVNLVYLMSTSDNYSVHTLMRYATAFVLIVPLVLIEEDRCLFTNIAEFMLTALVVCYIFTNNAAYLKMNLVQEQMNSYFTVLNARITSTDGYKDDMPVVFVGEFKINDENLTKMTDTYPGIQFLGYEYNAGDLINKESWKRYMRIHTGYEPQTGELTGDIVESEDFYNMNYYPNSDSIKIINGRVVVRFAD